MNTIEDMFQFAARHKLRFASDRGLLSAEQIWDLPLRDRSGFNLDAVARAAKKALSDLSEESFVSTERTPAHERAEVAFELVKHVISVKLAEEAAAQNRALARREKEVLLQILKEKQVGALSSMSVEDLQKRIDALGPT